jgi:hypothetical protein
MNLRTRLATALVLLATIGTVSSTLSAQPDELRALDGEWIFVEDRTEGRAIEHEREGQASRRRGRARPVAQRRRDSHGPRRFANRRPAGKLGLTLPRRVEGRRVHLREPARARSKRHAQRGVDPMGVARHGRGADRERRRRSPQRVYISVALPPPARHRHAHTGQSRDRRHGMAGRRVGRNEG